MGLGVRETVGLQKANSHDAQQGLVMKSAVSLKAVHIDKGKSLLGTHERTSDCTLAHAGPRQTQALQCLKGEWCQVLTTSTRW